MLNVWICFTILGIMLSGFSFSMRISGINRTFLLLPRGIFETAVVIIEREEGDKPYYDQLYLEHAVKQYFVKSLKPYTDTFEVAFSYFDKDEEDVVFLSKFDGVAIGLRVNIMLGLFYQNSLTFIIGEHE